MITIPGNVAAAKGLRSEDRDLVYRLTKAWKLHYARNVQRHGYYLMKNHLVDLGISIPPSLKNLDAACGWGKKCVKVMVDHLWLDMITSADEATQAEIDRIMRRTRLQTLYLMATTSALEQSFCLYFVSRDERNGHARVTAYPAQASGVTWDSTNACLEAALFVVSIKRDSRGYYTDEPELLKVVTPEYVIQLAEVNNTWQATYQQHGLKHLPAFVSVHEPALARPFGTSRITREVMGYIDSAVRANINEEIAAAFAAAPQKYLLGTDGDPFINKTRWDAFIGNIFNIDKNENGDIPTFGQLVQASMQPLSDHFRNLCGKMSAATGIHVSQFGQVHDNPASGQAIYQENEPLILSCKAWNNLAKETMADVMTACLATERGTTFDAIEDAGLEIVAHMGNPAMPTLAQITDSNVKIAAVVPGYSSTRTFWRTNGFTDEEVDVVLRELEEVRTEEARNAIVSSMFALPEPQEQTGEQTGASEVTDDDDTA